LVQKHGPHCELCKRDLKDAFHKIPISPLDYWLFMFEWEATLYVDVFLPFGLRTAAFIFNRFGEGLHWILESFGHDLVHYLDDFLLFNDPDPEFFGNLASYLGLAENLVQAIRAVKTLAEIQSIAGIRWEFTGLITSHGSRQRLFVIPLVGKKSPTFIRNLIGHPAAD